MSVVAAHTMQRDILDHHPNFFVKQTRKGFLMELCLGCDANTEFKIATMENTHQNIMYATEDTSCCIRMFLGNLRPFTITVSEGGERGGPVHSLHERPFACPLASCKCCCFQEIEVKSPTGAPNGRVVEDKWCCVPSFRVVDANENVQYNIHQPTCCGGACVDVCSDGCCNFRIPFNIYVPGKQDKGEEVGQVVKIWSPRRRVCWALPFLSTRCSLRIRNKCVFMSSFLGVPYNTKVYMLLMFYDYMSVLCVVDVRWLYG